MQARILVKIGGRAFDAPTAWQDLARAINASHPAEVIIVHGGGAEISQALKAARRETVFIDGIRVTPAEDIKIVEQVLSGTVNARIAAQLRRFGVASRRLSGKSEGLFQVTPLTRQGRDLGFVGRIAKVDPRVVLETLAAAQVPVISPISADDSGQSYNVNADSAAAALAVAAGCTDLVYFTDVPGVCIDGKTCELLSVARVRELIADGTIRAGMVAKMESVFEALEGRVERVHVVQWQGADTLHRILAAKAIPGTTITE